MLSSTSSLASTAAAPLPFYGFEEEREKQIGGLEHLPTSFPMRGIEEAEAGTSAGMMWGVAFGAVLQVPEVLGLSCLPAGIELVTSAYKEGALPLGYGPIHLLEY